MNRPPLLSRLLALAAVTLVAPLSGQAQPAASSLPTELREWPADAAPATLGTRMARNWLEHKFEFETKPTRKVMIYPEVCTWYGALAVARATGDTALQQQLAAKFDPFLTPEGSKRIDRRSHVDYRVAGIVPLSLYQQTKKPVYLELGQSFADAQWATVTPDGITSEARYWIDDMYMITVLQASAYRATGNPVYLDRAAKAMMSYVERLQQSNGLFHHAPDSPYFWGRGNGWFAAGFAELLRVLPADHPLRPQLVERARRMLSSLLNYQGEDGLWKQLVDKPASWTETSGSAMFTFAMIRGVKDGWLDAKDYAPAARKAWIALAGYVDADANVREVCAGTDKGFSEPYYLDRPRKVGDLHGQAAVLWCAMALLD